jgi:hypothetical protein
MNTDKNRNNTILSVKSAQIRPIPEIRVQTQFGFCSQITETAGSWRGLPDGEAAFFCGS